MNQPKSSIAFKMKKWTMKTFLIIFALTLVSLNVYAAEEPLEVSIDPMVINTQVIDEQASFRETIGISTSPAHITEVIQESFNKEAYEKYGMYLTDEEFKVFERTLEANDYIVSSLPEIVNSASKSLSEIASYRADFPNQKVYIYFSEETEQTQATQQRIEETFPYPEMLQFENVAYSKKQLEEKIDEISPFMLPGNFSEEYSINSLGVNVKENSIDVGIYPYEERFAQELYEKFGEMLIVKEREPLQQQARNSTLNNMQGGLNIAYTRSVSEGDGDCTIGFTAEKNNQDYVVTAGHCIESAVNSGQSYWYQGGEIIGAGSDYADGYNWDAGLILLTSSKNATNYIYKYQSFDSKYTRATNGPAYEGQPVCNSGITSGFQCGEVTAEYELINIGNRTVMRTVADYENAGGDSGGPIWYGEVLIGVHNAGNASSTNPVAAFSHMEWVLPGLDIEPIVRY